MGLETAAIIAAVAAAAPAIYGIGKDIFGPGTGPINEAGAKKMADMQKAASAYGAYRPDQADARMKAMSQQLSAYQGAGNIMQAMYGGSGSPAGGTYKGADPGSFAGGYKPPTWLPPIGNQGWPQTIGGMTFNSQAEYDAWKKATDARNQAIRDYEKQMGVPKGTPVSPPVYVPPTSGGLGAGSSGTSFTGPMSQSLTGPPDPMLGVNPMAMSLARNRTM